MNMLLGHLVVGRVTSFVEVEVGDLAYFWCWYYEPRAWYCSLEVMFLRKKFSISFLKERQYYNILTNLIKNKTTTKQAHVLLLPSGSAVTRHLRRVSPAADEFDRCKIVAKINLIKYNNKINARLATHACVA